MKTLLFFTMMLVALGLSAQEKFFKHIATAPTIAWANVSILDHPLLNGSPDAKVFISHYRDGESNNHRSGVFYFDGRWYIYQEDWEPIKVNSAYMVYIADADDAFRHDVALPMISSMLDHSIINGSSDKNPVYTHVNVANNDLCDFNLGFAYDAGFGTWNLTNLSLENIPSPSSYFITAEGADPAIIGYRHVTDSENLIDGGCTVIDHPQLNLNENAGIVFSHHYGSVDNPTGNVMVDKTFAIQYNWARGDWRICTEDFTTIPEGARFNLLFQADAIMNTNETQIENSSTAYPNPIIDKVNFSSKSIIQKISVHDFSGKIISESNPDSDKITMDLSKLRAGIYVAKIQTKEGVQTIKLIKK
ncbi:T9SS type A sorting domain-containing protein [Moheibacter sediminis]|uniref:Por secretion system C-terminal sorting domain-containing protein n=1 Tax=Moheibacter sediminis TaxID=1434700 RepID=A0A1W2BQS7_9FLAO|nr:T9SS type A sorting domain-containing protein [Moheibacter sediminis]SMC75355.1 Por secretion system C-terminal sorting domain-containing protein [Moheibacter sediminis]